MNADRPLVSIIIPVYNGANFMRYAIDSALKQTYKNLEVIVVNDGSNDSGETDRIAVEYGNRIRYIKKENGGVSSALNVGIREMRGEYFSWLSHDDEYCSGKIEKQIECLQRHGFGNRVALCGTEFIDVSGKKIDKKWKMMKTGEYSSLEALFEMKRRSLSGISLLIPRKALIDCGGFDESLRYTQDADMWRKVFLSGYSLVADTSEYARSRLHGGQQTNLHRERFIEEMERTAYAFSERCFEQGYFDLLRIHWYSLLKSGITNAAKQTQELLKKNNLMNSGTKMRGYAYLLYGKIRPLIRYLYYKFFFGITSKKNRG